MPPTKLRPEMPDEWWDHEDVVLVDGQLVRAAAPDPIEPIAQRVVDRVLAMLDVRRTTTPRDVEPALVDSPEAARLLGISVDALKWRVANGKIPGIVRTGRRVQFRREALMQIGTRRTTR